MPARSKKRLPTVSTLRALARLPLARPLESVTIPALERVLPARRSDDDKQKLSRFAALTSYADQPWLPLTWPHVAAFPAHLANLVDPRFPLPLPGLVHVAFHAFQWRPIDRTERVTLSASLSDARMSDKGLSFDLVTKAWVGHEKVWEGTATMLRRAPKRAAADSDIKETDKDGDKDKPRGPLFDSKAEQRTWMIPERVARSFARVTGDMNPIHLTPWTAKLFGFPGVVAHGMWSATRIAASHPELHERRDLELTCAFKLPVILPAKVSYRFWHEAAAGERGRLECRVLSEDGLKPHAIATLAWREAGTP